MLYCMVIMSAREIIVKFIQIKINLQSSVNMYYKLNKQITLTSRVIDGGRQKLGNVRFWFFNSEAMSKNWIKADVHRDVFVTMNTHITLQVTVVYWYTSKQK